MAEAKEEAVILELATSATTEDAQVPLNQFYLEDELFCLRPSAEFDKPSLQTLMDSLALEGQQTPVEAFIADTGWYVPTKVHRRLQSMRLLAAETHPRFKANILVPTYIVKEATHQDLLLRAVLDNEIRKNFNPIERVAIAKRFHEAGVPPQRAAVVLGVEEEEYQRDLIVATNG